MSPETVLATTAAASPPHVRGMMDLQGSLDAVLSQAHLFKTWSAQGRLPPLLAGTTTLVLFEKNSTRTRISFEVGIQKLGGIVSILDASTSQIARGESLADTGAVLSRYADALVYRAKDHASLTELASHATVPVVNALTDLEHPCQILADWMTLQEQWGHLDGKIFTYVGDGNNMCHSYLLAAPLVGMDIRVATPKGYAPDAAIVAQAQALAAEAGTEIIVTNDPVEAVTGADAVATDTWISMGDEAEEQERMAVFMPFQVNEALLAHAKPDCLFLHCLPGHWGQEATEDVAHGPRSVIYDEAENRMWTQMSLLVQILGRTPPVVKTS